MNVLIHSNAPWCGTGYGTQTDQLARELIADGHRVAVSSFYGLNGRTFNLDGIEVYPAGFDLYGNDVIVRHAEHWFGGNPRDGLVITLVDAWVLLPDVLKQVYCCCWAPIDHTPVPPRVLEVLRDSGCWPVAMSRHGEREMLKAGLDPFYAPHAINTDIFKPGDVAEAREAWSLPPDRFVVGMVAANKGFPPRKGWHQAIAAFAEFQRQHPEAVLFLHTEMSQLFGGVDLQALLAAHKVEPGSVIATNPYIQIVGTTPEAVATMYQGIDVLLNPSWGEGFGIPMLEAQACGIPVIVTDATSMSELGQAGWKVPGQDTFTEQKSFQTTPDVAEIVIALRAAYRQRAERPTEWQQLKDEAVAHAQAYHQRTVFDLHWRPLLETVEERMAPLELPVAA